MDSLDILLSLSKLFRRLTLCFEKIPDRDVPARLFPDRFVVSSDLTLRWLHFRLTTILFVVLDRFRWLLAELWGNFICIYFYIIFFFLVFIAAAALQIFKINFWDFSIVCKCPKILSRADCRFLTKFPAIVRVVIEFLRCSAEILPGMFWIFLVFSFLSFPPDFFSFPFRLGFRIILLDFREELN